MRKFVVLIWLVFMALAMSACYRADIVSDMKITSAEGAGSRTISAIILKDEADHPEEAGAKVEDNSAFFPKGIEAVRDALQESLPSGFEASLRDEADRWVLSISYQFSDIADYNAKTKQLVGEDVWTDKEVSETVITADKTDKGHVVTVTEEKMIIDYIVERYFKPIYDNPEIYSPTRGGAHDAISFNDSYSVSKATITIGNQTEEFVLNEEGNMVLELTATGTIAEDGQTGESPTDGADNGAGPGGDNAQNGAGEENPQTGDDAALTLYIVLALAALGIIAYIVYRRKMAQN